MHWQSWEGVIAIEVSSEEGLQLQLWRHQQDNVWQFVIIERKKFEFESRSRTMEVRLQCFLCQPLVLHLFNLLVSPSD